MPGVNKADKHNKPKRNVYSPSHPKRKINSTIYPRRKYQMENKKDRVDLHSELTHNFAYVPLPIRTAVIELRNQPLWREIGKALANVPIDETVDNTRLRNCIGDYAKLHNVGYMDIEKSLEMMEAEKYLKIDRNSEPVYHLTSKFVQGLEFIDKLEGETVRAIVNDLKDDEQYKKYPDLKNLVQSSVYFALEESIKQAAER
jgi:hypothetical protein